MELKKCANCSSQISCENLKQTLKVVKYHVDKNCADDTLLEYHQVLNSLRNNGWYYPHNTKACLFPNREVQIEELTNRLSESQTPSFKKVINSAPMIVREEQDIGSATENMLKSRSDCCLVIDQHDTLVGILTARDALRYFIQDQIQSSVEETSVSAVMSSPVEFLRLENIQEGLFSGFSTLGIKHFPIIRGNEKPKLSNIVGVITTRSLGTFMLTQFMQRKGKP